MGQGRTVVTGGAGFLGSHLAERMVEGGFAVTCFDNLVTGQRQNLAGLLGRADFELREVDVSAGFDVDGHVNAVLHFASPASPPAYLQFPIETMAAGSIGTRNALALAHRKNARFLLASTSEVYGDPQVHPQPETYWGHVNPVGPRAVYDEAKRFAEALTMAYRNTHDVDTAIVRIFNAYGPRMRPDDGRMIPTFIQQALRGLPLTITGDGSQTRSICYVDDLVEGLVRMLESSCAGPINIGNPQESSVLALAELIRDLVGSDSPITFVPRPQDDPHLRCPVIDLARTSLGWEPEVGLEDGLLRTIDWFRRVSSPRELNGRANGSASAPPLGSRRNVSSRSLVQPRSGAGSPH